MRMDYGIKLETVQRMVVTPQLRQAIAILQLSALELGELVEKELLDNPVLEIEEKGELETDPMEYRSEITINDYLDWEEYFGDTEQVRSNQAEKKLLSDYLTTKVVTLHEHIEAQLRLAVADSNSRAIGHYLIGCIDDNGYLCSTTEATAEDLGVSEELVAVVLEIIQGFEPIGVGARSLQECLKLQLNYRGIDNKLVSTIIDNFLAEVAAGRFKLLAEKLKCSRAEIQQAVDIIRTLDPKPGKAFGGSEPTYVLPDITIQKVSREYMIIINENNIPGLIINSYYRKVARADDENAKKFIEQKINSAVWLIKSIEQRKRTLYNVMKAIIELQRDFFDKGVKHLKPLTMKRVADLIGVHESTVSRATAGKYVDTGHGMFSMRVFFSQGVQASDGEDVSAANVKREIAGMIKQEESVQPLSDQMISDYLGQKGLTVSRRTVAKYREELGIAASGKRKRY